MHRITVVIKECVPAGAWRGERGKLYTMFFNPAGAWRGERRVWWPTYTLVVIDAQKRSFRFVRVCVHHLLRASCLVFTGDLELIDFVQMNQ